MPSGPRVYLPSCAAGPTYFLKSRFYSSFRLLRSAAISVNFTAAPHSHSIPSRVQRALGVGPQPEDIVPAAVKALVSRGLKIDGSAAKRLVLLAKAIHFRTQNDGALPFDISALKCDDARRWLRSSKKPRRVFPQTLFHWLLHEAGIYSWANDQKPELIQAVCSMSVSSARLLRGWRRLVGPGRDLKWQIIALANWGASSARAAEAPLLVSPNAVSITTVHSAKGLEFPVVFLADVKARRFPSSRSTRVNDVPFDAKLQKKIDPALLADNDNYDNGRRLMYVALTRAERYLFISYSGKQKSTFIKQLAPLVREAGGLVQEGPLSLSKYLEHYPATVGDEDRLTTNFSDLRYFLECPRDFYLRNVLGFTPTIGQEFGYGRGVHNLLRAVHSDPKKWATRAGDPGKIEQEVRRMIDQGMFYLRYTTGDPLDNLKNKAVKGLVEYVKNYADELAKLRYEPEREFKTLFPDEKLLIAGTIDVLRLDDLPRVTIIDFKSGDAKEQTGSGLTEELMALQIGVYGLAAKHELEYARNTVLFATSAKEIRHGRKARRSVGRRACGSARKAGRNSKKIRQREFQRGPTGFTKDRCELAIFSLFAMGGSCNIAQQGQKGWLRAKIRTSSEPLSDKIGI